MALTNPARGTAIATKRAGATVPDGLSREKGYSAARPSRAASRRFLYLRPARSTKRRSLPSLAAIFLLATPAKRTFLPLVP